MDEHRRKGAGTSDPRPTQEEMERTRAEAIAEEKAKRTRNITGGLILIFIGAAFLLERLGVVDLAWPLVVLGIGVAFLLKAAVERSTGPVFVGTLLTLLGLVFLLQRSDMLPWGLFSSFPLYVVTVGLAFLVSWLVDRSLRGHMITAGILLVVGVPWLLVGEDVIESVFDWWPLILLVIGAYMLFRGRRPKDAGRDSRNTSHEDSPTP
jgi:hypothetical protein